jgi:chromosome segregation ATPase
VNFVADDKNDQPLGSQTIGAANGKDVLYGWLVGRAAADLGLAQAIAASEAQRAEQIKRLEDALLGQMRELQNSHASSAGSSVDDGIMHRLQDQVEQFGERQNFLEAQQLTIGQIEAQLSAKIQQLATQIERPPEPIANFEIVTLRSELAALSQRVARAESQAADQSEVSQRQPDIEQITFIVREQTAALQNQFDQQLLGHTTSAETFKTLETSWQQKLDAVQQEMREKSALLRLREGELSDLRGQLATVVQRLDQLAVNQPTESVIQEREAERALWQRDFDERLTARLRELGDEIRGKLQTVTGVKVDQEHFRGETLALTARIAQLEQSQQNANAGVAAEAREAYQATLALRGEISALRHVLEQAQQAKPDDGVVRQVEEALSGQIHELRNQLDQNQRGAQGWENQFNQLRGDIQSLMQRQQQAEASAKQTLALLTQETGQIRAGLKADLVAMEAQLNERRSRDSAIQAIEETLTLRMRELHNQLAQGTLLLDQRDGELQQLKNQVQLLNQRIGSGAFGAASATINRPDSASTSAPLASIGVVAAGLPAVEPTPTLFQAVAPGNGQAAEPARISATELHDRLSAEIERKRAELREKSGRWKVRQ